MICQVNGIALHHFKYSEESEIAKVYTDRFGLLTFFFSGMRKKKSKNRAALLQPLTVLDIVIWYNEKKNMQRIREASVVKPFSNIHDDNTKRALSFFIAEILYRTIKEEEQNLPLYQFIKRTVEMLDNSIDNCSCFHLSFIICLSRFLGFYPQGRYSGEKIIFDLKEGIFISSEPSHPHFINSFLSQSFDLLLGTEFAAFHTLNFSRPLKKTLVEKLLEYYRLHLPQMGQINSKNVLEDVFNC